MTIYLNNTICSKILIVSYIYYVLVRVSRQIGDYCMLFRNIVIFIQEEYAIINHITHNITHNVMFFTMIKLGRKSKAHLGIFYIKTFTNNDPHY